MIEEPGDHDKIIYQFKRNCLEVQNDLIDEYHNLAAGGAQTGPLHCYKKILPYYLDSTIISAYASLKSTVLSTQGQCGTTDKIEADMRCPPKQ